MDVILVIVEFVLIHPEVILVIELDRIIIGDVLYCVPVHGSSTVIDPDTIGTCLRYRVALYVELGNIHNGYSALVLRHNVVHDVDIGMAAVYYYAPVIRILVDIVTLDAERCNRLRDDARVAISLDRAVANGRR